jgi:ribonuclease E
MIVRQKGDRTQIAVLEDGILVEHYVTRASAQSYAGNVYLGRVQNVLPSMEAAFVDIGKSRNAVLYAGEVNYNASAGGRSRSIESVLKSARRCWSRSARTRSAPRARGSPRRSACPAATWSTCPRAR